MDARQVTVALPRRYPDAQENPTPTRPRHHAGQPSPATACLPGDRASPIRSEEIREAAVASLAAQRGADLRGPLEPHARRPGGGRALAALPALATGRPSGSASCFCGASNTTRRCGATSSGPSDRSATTRLIPKMIAIFGACTPASRSTPSTRSAPSNRRASNPSSPASSGTGPARPPPRRAGAGRHRLGDWLLRSAVAAALRDANAHVRLTLSKALASCPHPIARRDARAPQPRSGEPAVAAAARAEPRR